MVSHATTSPGSAFRKLTILCAKEHFLQSSLQPILNGLKILPLVRLSIIMNNFPPSRLSKPFKILTPLSSHLQFSAHIKLTFSL